MWSFAKNQTVPYRIGMALPVGIKWREFCAAIPGHYAKWCTQGPEVSAIRVKAKHFWPYKTSVLSLYLIGFYKPSLTGNDGSCRPKKSIFIQIHCPAYLTLAQVKMPDE